MRLARWTVMTAVALTAAAATTPSVASAQSGEAQIQRVLKRLEHEPSVSETTSKALEYFRVDPDSFDDLRSSARSRAWLPLLATGYRFDNDQTSQGLSRSGMPTFTDELNADRNIHSATVGLVWDFREAVFNPAEVQVFGLIGVQRDLMLETTRTYYLRRQLLLRLALRAPEDPLARAALQLRIDEFTAILNVLTGGWFTEEAARRKKG